MAARGAGSAGLIARLLLLAGFVALIAALVQWRVVDREPAADDGNAGATSRLFPDRRRSPGIRRGRQAADRPAVHFSDPGPGGNGIVRLSDVAVDYHTPTGQTWNLTSNEARVPQGGSIVEFEGDVLLAGRPGAEPQTAELHTQRLVLDTVGEVADTRSPVELAFGDHRLRALGMHADLKTGSMQLEFGRQWPLHAVRVAAALLAIACAAATAQERDQLPIQLKANSLNYDTQKGVIEYYAGAITQGAIRISADRAVTTGVDFSDSTWEFRGRCASLLDAALASVPARVRLYRRPGCDRQGDWDAATLEQKRKDELAQGRAKPHRLRPAARHDRAGRRCVALRRQDRDDRGKLVDSTANQRVVSREPVTITIQLGEEPSARPDPKP